MAKGSLYPVKRNHLHNKTHFKAATSVLMQNNEKSLNMNDEACREIVKDAFKIVGKELPEGSVNQSNFSLDELDNMAAKPGQEAVISKGYSLKKTS